MSDEEEPKPSLTTVREVCSCGAEVEMQAAEGRRVLRYVTEWRTAHRCEPSEEKRRVVGFVSDHDAA